MRVPPLSCRRATRSRVVGVRRASTLSPIYHQVRSQASTSSERVHLRSGWMHHVRTLDGSSHDVENTAAAYRVKRHKRLSQTYFMPIRLRPFRHSSVAVCGVNQTAVGAGRSTRWWSTFVVRPLWRRDAGQAPPEHFRSTNGWTLQRHDGCQVWPLHALDLAMTSIKEPPGRSQRVGRSALGISAPTTKVDRCGM